MKTETTYRRICNARWGLNAHVEEHRFESGPEVEDSALDSVHKRRIETPLKRVSGRLESVSWNDATNEIGAALKAVRKKHGPRGLGIYIGETGQQSARTMIRSLAFGIGGGTPHLFSEANLSFAPVLWATEKMVGHAAALMSDLSRAHYILLLSGEQRSTGWGPFSPGEGHEDWIQHSRKTKKTKVVVADPRKTELADTMDKPLPIRPGSESYLMLGMLTAIVQSGWIDDQFIRDYTADFERLKTLTKDWEVDKFAALCGIEAAELNGVALSFSRSAMAVIHPATHSFQNEAGAMGAWAWLAIHAVTANILRPGGLFENKGIIDLFSVLTQVRSDKAPKTDGTGHPLLLMQAPASAIPETIHQGSLRGLVTVCGDPVGRLPRPESTQAALNELDLLVCISEHHNDTTAVADWVLPASPSYAQTALAISSDPATPPTWTRPQPNDDAQGRPAETILATLYAQLKPGLRGSVWGRHLGLFAQFVARADLEQWEQKLLSDHLTDPAGRWSVVVDESVARNEHSEDTADHLAARFLHIGDGDRSLWRPSTGSERIELIIDTLLPMIQSLSLKEPAPMVLRAGQWTDDPTKLNGRAIVCLHPDGGFDEGDRVEIRTDHGACEATVTLDERLRPDVLDIPFYPGNPSLNLLPSQPTQATIGALIMNGLSASVAKLGV